MDQFKSGYHGGGGSGGNDEGRGNSRGGGGSRRSQDYHRRPQHQHTYSRGGGGGPNSHNGYQEESTRNNIGGYYRIRGRGEGSEGQSTSSHNENGYPNEPSQNESGYYGRIRGRGGGSEGQSTSSHNENGYPNEPSQNESGYYGRIRGRGGGSSRGNGREYTQPVGPVRSQRRGGTVFYQYGGESTSADSTWRDGPDAEEPEEVVLPPPPEEIPELMVTKRVKPKPVLVDPSTVPKPIPTEPESRREALIEQLTNCTYECMVCCGKIYQRQPTWSCQVCFNVFHLTCIKKWVDSSAIEEGWRCPGCQTVVDYYPADYYCYCRRVKNPPFTSGIPHSCLNACDRNKIGGPDCTHKCSYPSCHPGPCETCTDIVSRKCECGKSQAYVQCQSKNPVVCGQVCGKMLNCEVHFCEKLCHAGECNVCEVNITLDCFCGRNKKDVSCSTQANLGYLPKYSCEVVCDKLLNCKNHQCQELCHEKNCKPCRTSTNVVLSCPCGQTAIAEACKINNLAQRASCFDPIPTCSKICSKVLPCGPAGDKHHCDSKCHDENKVPCTCSLRTSVKCRCGTKEFEIPCTEFRIGNDILCARKCTKKRNCGRHKCTNKCCIDLDHICTIVCDKLLACGNHRCASLCHNGHCTPCASVSFEELRCECGEAVIYPPVPCGTPTPYCAKPCTRAHECGHPVHHYCHTEHDCPPCTVLTEKWCYGKHELRKNVPCNNKNVSCGMPCGQLLRCGRHKCPRICHPGICQKPDDTCRIACGKRLRCSHPCSAPCHERGCPEITCKQLTEASCPCGRRKEAILCWKRGKEFEKVVAAAVAQALNDMFKEDEQDNDKEKEKEMSVEEITGRIRSTTSRIIVLDCDKECSRIERTRKMAEALQLHNADVETRLGPPNYSEFLKKFAQKSPHFVETVHDKLSALVLQTQAKKSTKKNHTYAFESMNRDKRTVIHEYSDHFGIQSESFDDEPNRNVIVTASKEKCWLPSKSLIEVVFGNPASTSDLGRKNVYEDLELAAAPRGQIQGPANMKFFKRTQ